MTRNQLPVLVIAGVLLGCGGSPSAIRLKVDPPQIAKDGGQATVSATLLKDVKKDVTITFDVSEGRECGTIAIDPQPKPTDDYGFTWATFKPNATVATPCQATISATRAVDPAGAKNQAPVTVEAPITVLPTVESVTIEATSAITIVLIASFAIDRIVSVLMLWLPIGRKPVPSPDAQPDTEEGKRILESEKRKERLIYVALAGVLGLALGYFGKIRILEGLGFSNNVPINVLLTALILTAGSDSISALLKRMGGGAVGEPEPKPLEVRGNLVLERPAEVKRGASRRAERKGEEG
jgi:hypothetical protein